MAPMPGSADVPWSPAPRPGLPVQLAVVAVISVGLFLAYGGGYVALDPMWSVVWGRDLAALQPLSSGGTTTPHVLSNLIGAVISPLGADADRGLIAIGYLAAGGLVWFSACLAREIAGPAAAVVAGVLVATREQLLYAATSNFLDVLTATLLVWAAWLAVRSRAWAPQEHDGPAIPWAPAVLLFLAGLLRPEAWALAGAWWLWAVVRGRGPALGRLALVVAAPVAWLVTDAALSGDALFSVHETTRVNALVREGRGIPDTLVEHVGSIPRTLAKVGGPELLLLAAVLALVALWPALARRKPLSSVALAPGQQAPVRFLIAAAAIFAAVIAAEAITGSLLFARFALALMSVMAVLVAVLLVGLARSLAGGEAGPARRRSAILVGAVVVVVLAQVPFLVDARRTTGQERDRYEAARAVIRPGVPCTPVATPNVNMLAFVAAWTDLRGKDVVDATAGIPAEGTFVTATGADAEKLLRDPSFPQLAGFPAAPPVRAGDGWVVTSRCGTGG